MRLSRLLALMIVGALLGLLPAATGTASASAPTADRQAVKIGIKITKSRGKLFMVGNVKPRKPRLVVQKATNCRSKNPASCNWKGYKKIKVGNKGHYKVRVYAPKRGSWAWRGRIGNVTSDTWLTCRQRPGQTSCPKP